jgi:outer membrane receptor for ferrienterochelin and colicin
MFGKTTMERLKARAALLQQNQRRGRQRKGEKSSSGGRLPSGKMSLQVNGRTLDRQVDGPNKSALKGVTERCGSLVTVEGLVSQNLIHGRIQVFF